MTRVQTEYPHYFTVEDLTKAWRLTEPWSDLPHLRMEAATIALLGDGATEAERAAVVPLIRQAAEEA